MSLYVCSSKNDGGLGITPGASDWSRVESVMALHDQQWNDKWIKKWSTSLGVNASLDQLRAQVRQFTMSSSVSELIITLFQVYTALPLLFLIEF